MPRGGTPYVQLGVGAPLGEGQVVVGLVVGRAALWAAARPPHHQRQRLARAHARLVPVSVVDPPSDPQGLPRAAADLRQTADDLQRHPVVAGGGVEEQDVGERGPEA